MSTRYYKKDIPQMPVYVHGTPLKFEVLETSDSALITELDRCIQFGRGGILAISKEQFEEAAKKKPSGTISESAYKQRLHRQELSAPHLSPSHAVDGASPEVRVGNAFAKPQGREHRPHTQHGLPSGTPGPAPASRPMPDPIELPKAADLKPPTAKMKEVNGA